MTDDLILFRIEGPDGDETARELFDLLRTEFGVRPERMDRETRRRVDPAGSAEPVAVTALIIAIPAAALGGSDPSEPFAVREKLEKATDWAKEKTLRSPEERLTVQIPGGQSQPLGTLDVDALMAAAP
jgi:hypothetical protein